MADLPPLNLPEILAAHAPMTEPPLNLLKILAAHARWLFDPATGQRANLGNANLRGVNLGGADLRDADLRDADLRDADLRDADLRGATLSDANLRGATLSDANLRGVNLRDADLQRATLNDADLRGANLQGANLQSADLRGARLRGANLRGANLRGARLCDASLTGVLALAIAADAPQRLRAAATAALADGALNMKTWHSCDTIHCLGGWLIHQAGEVGRLLEGAVGPEVAGLMLGGIEAHAHFYDSDEAVTKWLQSVLARPEVQA
jgi:uncharacterized protein YjbI with pentapeptide repeats